MRSVFVAALAASASALKTKEALPWFDAIETGVKVGLHQGTQNTWTVAAHTTETFADGNGAETQTQSNDAETVVTTTPVEGDFEGSTLLLEVDGKIDYNCDFAFTQDFQGHITHIHADASAEKAECVKSKTALANLFESHASEEGELEFTKHAPWTHGRLAQVDYKMNVQSDGTMTIGHKATQGNEGFEVGDNIGFNAGGGSESSTSTYAADGSLNEVDVTVNAIAGASAGGGVDDVQVRETKAFVQTGDLPTGDGGATPQIVQANSNVVMSNSGSADVETVAMPANLETRKYTAPATFFDAENAHDTARDDVSYAEYSKDLEKSFAHFEKLAEADPENVASYIAKDLAANKRDTVLLNKAISVLGKCGAHGQETLISLVQGSNAEQKSIAFSAIHELEAPTQATTDALFAISEGKTEDACAADLALGAMASNFDDEDKIAKRLYENYESAKAFGKTNSCGLMGVSNAEFSNVEIFDDIKEAVKSAKTDGKLQEIIMLYDSLRMSTATGVDAYLNAEFQSVDQSHHALLAPLMDIMSKRNGKESEKSIDTLKSLVEKGHVTSAYVQKKMSHSFKRRTDSHASPAAAALLETINAQEGWNNVQEGESASEVTEAHCAGSTKSTFYGPGANFSGENGRISGHEDDDWVRKLPQSSPLYNVKTASALGKHMKYGYEVYGGIQAGMDLTSCQMWASAGGGLQIFFMETDSSGNDTDGFEFIKQLVEGFAGAQFSDNIFTACAYMKYFKITASAKKVDTGASDKNGVVCNDGWTGSSCNCNGNVKQTQDFSGCCAWHSGYDNGVSCKKFKFSASAGDKWLLSPQTLGPLTIACGTNNGCNQCTGVQGAPPQVTQNNSGTKTLIQASFTFTFWGLVSVTITVKITSYFYTQYGYSLISGTSNGTPLGSGCGYPAAYAYFKPGVVLTFTIIADVGIACPSGYKNPLPSSGYVCTASIGFGGDIEIVDFGTPLTATINGWTNSAAGSICAGIQAQADFFAGRLFVRATVICARICVNVPWGRRRRRRRQCAGGCTKGPSEYTVATWTAPATWTATIAQTLCCDASNRRRRGIPPAPIANNNPAQRRRRRRYVWSGYGGF